MADVFVSYDRRDRDLAEKVVGALTEQGLTVWWDDRITPHETWDKTIEREVDSARRVLVLWTNHSVQSDWVRTEAGAAKESTPPKLIQARFSDCKVPLAFRLLQHVDLIGWSPKKKHAGWDRMVGWLKDDSASAAQSPAPPPVQPPAPPKPAQPAPVAEATPAAPSWTPPATPEPAAPQAPMGFANLAAADAVSNDASASPTEAATGSAPAAGMGGAGGPPPGAVPPSQTFGQTPGQAQGGQNPDNKKILIIAGAVVGGLILIVVLMSLLGGGGGGGNAGGGGGGGTNGTPAEMQRTLAGYLTNYQGRFADGASQVGQDEYAHIADGGEHSYQVQLDAGTRYVILGACDTNCADVDLFVSDPENNTIGQDVLLDDYPVVSITPAVAGRYTVRIGMANCRTEPCYGAARVTRAG